MKRREAFINNDDCKKTFYLAPKKGQRSLHFLRPRLFGDLKARA